VDKATVSVDKATTADADARAVRLVIGRLPRVGRGGLIGGRAPVENFTKILP
jgi:hypothetical protein